MSLPAASPAQITIVVDDQPAPATAEERLANKINQAVIYARFQRFHMAGLRRHAENLMREAQDAADPFAAMNELRDQVEERLAEFDELSGFNRAAYYALIPSHSTAVRRLSLGQPSHAARIRAAPRPRGRRERHTAQSTSSSDPGEGGSEPPPALAGYEACPRCGFVLVWASGRLFCPRRGCGGGR
jgi:hypothetical protein